MCFRPAAASTGKVACPMCGFENDLGAAVCAECGFAAASPSMPGAPGAPGATTFVALIALGLLFLPGTSMITVKEYRSESPWGILLMMASINGIVKALSASGAVSWIVNMLLSVASDMSFVALFLVCPLRWCFCSQAGDTYVHGLSPNPLRNMPLTKP